MTESRRPPRLAPARRRPRPVSARRGGRPGREARAAALHLVPVDRDGTEGPSGDIPLATPDGPARRSSDPTGRATRAVEAPRQHRESSPAVLLEVVPGGADPADREENSGRGEDRADRDDGVRRRRATDRGLSGRRRGSGRAHRQDERRRRRERRRHDRDLFAADGDADAGASRRRVGIAVLCGVTLAAAALVVIAQPFGQWRSQQRDIAEAHERLEDVREQRRLIREQTEEMRGEAAIRRYARAMFEMVDPGEDLVIVLPSSVEDLGLPDIWPFTGVERELGTG